MLGRAMAGVGRGGSWSDTIFKKYTFPPSRERSAIAARDARAVGR